MWGVVVTSSVAAGIVEVARVVYSVYCVVVSSVGSLVIIVLA